MIVTLRKLLQNKGQGSIEFVFSLIIFIVMLFTILDASRVMYTWASLQYAANRGVRMVKEMIPMQAEDKVQRIKSEIISTAEDLGVELGEEELTVTMNGNTVGIDIVMPLRLTQMTGVLLSLSGNHSGSFDIRAFEEIRNESL